MVRATIDLGCKKIPNSTLLLLGIIVGNKGRRGLGANWTHHKAKAAVGGSRRKDSETI